MHMTIGAYTWMESITTGLRWSRKKEDITISISSIKPPFLIQALGVQKRQLKPGSINNTTKQKSNKILKSQVPLLNKCLQEEVLRQGQGA